MKRKKEPVIKNVIITLRALIKVLSNKNLIHPVTASTLLDMIDKDKDLTRP